MPPLIQSITSLQQLQSAEVTTAKADEEEEREAAEDQAEEEEAALPVLRRGQGKKFPVKCGGHRSVIAKPTTEEEAALLVSISTPQRPATAAATSRRESPHALNGADRSHEEGGGAGTGQ